MFREKVGAMIAGANFFSSAFTMRGAAHKERDCRIPERMPVFYAGSFTCSGQAPPKGSSVVTYPGSVNFLAGDLL